MRVSYFEVCDDRIHDLLEASDRDHPVGGWAEVSLTEDGQEDQVIKRVELAHVDGEGGYDKRPRQASRTPPTLTPGTSSKSILPTRFNNVFG